MVLPRIFLGNSQIKSTYQYLSHCPKHSKLKIKKGKKNHVMTTNLGHCLKHHCHIFILKVKSGAILLLILTSSCDQGGCITVSGLLESESGQFFLA